jgi:FKBP-type peptidyl-prolyl cis-trans isomerase
MEKGLKIFFTTLAIVLISFLVLLILSAFNENLNKPPATEIQEEIQAFEEAEDAEEFAIEILEEGEGEEAKSGDILTVHYAGRLLDGQLFDSSYERGEPFMFVLGEGRVIQGWEEGLEGMKVNEKRLITIPSHMGYGEMGSGNIPPNAGLEFEVELLAIEQPEDED